MIISNPLEGFISPDQVDNYIICSSDMSTKDKSSEWSAGSAGQEHGDFVEEIVYQNVLKPTFPTVISVEDLTSKFKEGKRGTTDVYEWDGIFKYTLIQCQEKIFLMLFMTALFNIHTRMILKIHLILFSMKLTPWFVQ